MFLVACEQGMNNLSVMQPTDTTGVERAVQIELLYSDSSVVRAKINAPTMLFHLDSKDPKREFPNGIRATFYDASSRPSSQLSAKYAVQSDREKNIILRDSVVVWNNRSERLNTEELFWDEQKQTISSTKRVRITTPTEIISGFGFRANMDFTNWEIDSVSGRIRSNNLMDSPI